MVDIKSLRCPECHSTDLDISQAEEGKEGELECNDCGYTSVVERVKLARLFNQGDDNGDN